MGFCCHFRVWVSLAVPLRWRHNERDSVSNHQPHDCLLNGLFRRRSKKTSKLRVTGLCVENSPGPVNSPHKGPVTRKMFPFDDVIMLCAISCFSVPFNKGMASNFPHMFCFHLLIDLFPSSSEMIFWLIFSCTIKHPWWRHQMETSSVLLALCVGNSPVTGEFPSQRPVTGSFDVFFDLCLNKRLSKQSRGWWFEMPSCPLWCHCNDSSFFQRGLVGGVPGVSSGVGGAGGTRGLGVLPTQVHIPRGSDITRPTFSKRLLQTPRTRPSHDSCT